MKKAIAILLILTLALGLPAGCGGGNDAPTDSDNDNGNNDNGNNDNNNNGNSGNSGNPDAAEQPTPQTPDPPVSDETPDIGNDPNPQELGEKLAAAYIDVLNSDSYYMKYRSLTESAGQTMESTMETAVNGDVSVLIAIIGGKENIIIFRDDKMHLVDHINKKVFISPAGISSNKGVLPTTDYVFQDRGSSELFGVSHNYEDYATEDGVIRFFFEGDKLLGFESDGGDSRVQMEILELSKNIPPGIFDLPEGYDVIEY